MPISFKVADRVSETTRLQPGRTSAELLEGSAYDEFSRIERIIQSSLTEEDLASYPVEPSYNGFSDTVLRAYNQHHHLVLRPDDVWQAIILQFNFYVNAHAEDLRHLFVPHKGKKHLTVIVKVYSPPMIGLCFLLRSPNSSKKKFSTLSSVVG